MNSHVSVSLILFLRICLVNYHFIVLEPIGNNFRLRRKVLFNSPLVFAMADKELSSLKLYTDTLETKKNKSFIEKLNKISPVMEP